MHTMSESWTIIEDVLLPNERIPAHPGEILREEFLNPLGLTAATLASHIGMSASAVEQVVEERAPITPQLAWLLGWALGTSPEFWLNLQSGHDLALARPRRQIDPLPRTG